MDASQIAAISGAIVAILAGLTALITAAKTGRKVDAVATAVNGTNTAQAARVDQLTAVLADAKVPIPPTSYVADNPAAIPPTV